MTTDDDPDRALAARLRAGETLAGLIVKMPAPATVEMAGHAGFDFVVIDAEHGPGDGAELEHHLRAAASAGVGALVRVGALTAIDVLRALDAGADGIIVPHVNDAEAAATAVRFAHYPPVGERGLATSTRAGHHGFVPLAEHLRRADEETLVVVQIEHAEALAHATSIASVPRVDAIFLGPTDLSMSLGHPGDAEHPTVTAAIDGVATDVAAAQGAALCVLVDDEEQARAWQDRGARLVLFSASALLAGTLRRAVRGLGTTPA